MTLKPRRSIDLIVKQNESVSVGQGRGVYDLLTGDSMVRAGVFRGEDTPVIAELSTSKFLYRVINAGEVDIQVKVGSATKTIKPDSSADILFGGTVSVDSTEQPDGIFELLLGPG